MNCVLRVCAERLGLVKTKGFQRYLDKHGLVLTLGWAGELRTATTASEQLTMADVATRDKFCVVTEHWPASPTDDDLDGLQHITRLSTDDPWSETFSAFVRRMANVKHVYCYAVHYHSVLHVELVRPLHSLLVKCPLTLNAHARVASLKLVVNADNVEWLAAFLTRNTYTHELSVCIVDNAKGSVTEQLMVGLCRNAHVRTLWISVPSLADAICASHTKIYDTLFADDSPLHDNYSVLQVLDFEPADERVKKFTKRNRDHAHRKSPEFQRWKKLWTPQ